MSSNDGKLNFRLTYKMSEICLCDQTRGNRATVHEIARFPSSPPKITIEDLCNEHLINSLKIDVRLLLAVLLIIIEIFCTIACIDVKYTEARFYASGSVDICIGLITIATM